MDLIPTEGQGGVQPLRAMLEVESSGQRDGERCKRHNVPITVETVNSFMGRKTFEFCPVCTEEEVAEKEIRDRKRLAREKQEEINRRLENAMISPRFKDKTFENYSIESDGQAFNLSACRAFVANMDRTPGMILFGNPGTGKNHMACAVLKEAIRMGRTGLMTTGSKIVRAIKETWGTGKESEAMRRFLDPDILVIDEVGARFEWESMNGRDKGYVCEIIHDRHEWLKPTLILSNLDVEELRIELGERIIDRFRESGGKCLVFDWESYRHKTI